MDPRRSSANFSDNDMEDPPILYLRNAILVRDPARAASELTPEGRAWLYTIFLSAFAAIVGSVVGMLAH